MTIKEMIEKCRYLAMPDHDGRREHHWEFFNEIADTLSKLNESPRRIREPSLTETLRKAERYGGGSFF